MSENILLTHCIMEKKVFLKFLFCTLFVSVFVLSGHFESNRNSILPEFTLSNIEILARNEGPAGCPEGHGCTYSGPEGTCSTCCSKKGEQTCNWWGCKCGF